ncbi:disintegrin and metalloproteinase domain-containing protein 15 isoform X1 [Corythoichthys intestinalis]|uniref:disintegrin and metalloproteinase domain-containing protein 15 isoform X1 n=1 Tax=Corythoichthys intestinalis TaxID=161448 RepID=UPI0025A60896|nr:disintegrin and metalloproteinase domain-containing protein 15 isoform X1 [Corythoichthys intestinalis]
MKQLLAPRLLVLISAGVALTDAGPLNATPQDGVEWRRPLLERTQPFVLVGGRKRSLKEALQGGHPEHLQCGLEVRGEVLVLDLQKNHDLLPKSPNVFFYLPNGTGVSLNDDPVTHCYYHGNVRGFPSSRVAISTCSGLRGVIAVNASLSFEVQPHEIHHDGVGSGEGGTASGLGGEEEDSRENGDHLIFSSSHVAEESVKGCGVSHGHVDSHVGHTNDHSATHVLHRSKRNILSETKYIELVLVADHQEFLNYQKNNKTIIYRMLDVANQVDWFYRPLKVRVALTGLEVWSDRDKIRVEKNPSATLNNFLLWRTRELLPRLRHDNAQLIMGSALDGTTVGMAAQASMCSRDRSGGVNVDHLVSILGVASTVAHELGHNLGMSHDTQERHCHCTNQPRMGGCIMEPSTGFLPGQQFSSCSVSDLSVSLLRGGGMCLFNVPPPERLLGGPRCGNLYVEPGEECDCGLLEECQDPCCNASTCRLHPGAQCSADGVCCQDCKLRAAGSVCREPIGECDLPEYCTGSSPFCPPNVYIQNGEPCEDGATYCYGGACASMRAQCQMLWGPNATSAPAVCFSSVNKQGNKYGNCGQLSNGSYAPCAPNDVQCGRIQCQDGTDRPLLGTNAEILTTTVRFNLRDLVCRGTFFHLGDDVSDPASVAQGTACGPGKACLDHKCQDVSVFGVDDCRKKCNGHGVCNSMNNCHCQPGWAPPDCAYAGHGGSVDSGPAHIAAESDPVLVALLVLFLIILPALLLFLALRFPRVRRVCLALGGSKFFPKSSHNRTPATERSSDRNVDQIRPLRFDNTALTDVRETPPLKELLDRPAPPTKPLPPVPPLNPSPQPSERRPAPPTKPLPPAPPTRGVQLLASRPAPPTKPLPPDPFSPGQASDAPTVKPAVPKKPRPHLTAASSVSAHSRVGRPPPSRPRIPPRPEQR